MSDDPLGIAATAAHLTRRLMRHQERYVKAWIAATGIHPSEAVLCHTIEMRDGQMVDLIWVERKEDSG